MVALFVPLRVLTDQAADVGYAGANERIGGKEGIQLLHKALIAAVERNHAGDILLDGEGILPGIGFRVFIAHQRVGDKGRTPDAAGFPAPEETRGAVKQVPVVRGAPVKQLGVLRLVQGLGEPRNAPVIERIFDGAGRGRRARSGGDIAGFLVRAQAVAILHGSVAHGLVGSLDIETAEPGEIGLGDHVHRVVADHAPSFIGAQRPDGRGVLAQFVIFGEHGLHHVIDPARMKQGK